MTKMKKYMSKMSRNVIFSESKKNNAKNIAGGGSALIKYAANKKWDFNYHNGISITTVGFPACLPSLQTPIHKGGGQRGGGLRPTPLCGYPYG